MPAGYTWQTANWKNSLFPLVMSTSSSPIPPWLLETFCWEMCSWLCKNYLSRFPAIPVYFSTPFYTSAVASYLGAASCTSHVSYQLNKGCCFQCVKTWRFCIWRDGWQPNLMWFWFFACFQFLNQKKERKKTSIIGIGFGVSSWGDVKCVHVPADIKSNVSISKRPAMSPIPSCSDRFPYFFFFLTVRFHIPGWPLFCHYTSNPFSN